MILDFAQIHKDDILRAGGKGANLGEMTAAGINVPKGFVITADAYREFLKENKIDEIILSGQEEKFGWLQDIIQPHIHTDMGISSVNRLVKDLNAKLLDKGYVTSRIVIPEQNMKNGKLLLRIQTGRLHKIIYSKNSAVIPWKNAFPIKEGDILNIRRLEQGLEQMKRVSSSDVSMKLLPADNI